MINPVDPYIDQLLHDAQTITESFERVSKATGEHFNLFSILGIETREVTTHSRFIAELLNPLGSHGKGRVFLDLFIDVLEIKNYFQDGLPKVFVEKSFIRGANGENITGRVDILIRSNSGSASILIENKIYAREQEDQLGRYKKFLPDSNLFFLTLYGDKSTQSGSQVCHYTPISYRDTITRWLELCRKESASSPILRETITIYLNLVKKLTNQNINSEMSNEIVKRILNNSNNTSLNAYIDLLNAEMAVRNSIFNIRVVNTIKAISEELDLELNFIKGFPYSKDIYSGFSLSNKILENKGLKIEFQFQNSRWSDLIFGFTHYNGNVVSQGVKANFEKELGPFYSSDAWPFYKRFDGYENWASRDAWLKINTNEFMEILASTIRTLYRIGTTMH